MVTQESQIALREIAKCIGEPAPEKWEGLDIFIPFLEKMRQEMAVVLLEWQGNIHARSYIGPYAASVTGDILGREGYYRQAASSMEEALAQVIIHYARLKWNFVEAT
ncbi:MAG: hypothetical protein PVS3B3_37870 [Ktedonobacteraceae bacterium]